MSAIVAPRRRESVVDVPLDAGRFLGLRVATPSVVALTGSFRLAVTIDPRAALLQRLVAALIGCGSVERNQFAMADMMDGIGAALSIDSNLQRVSFSIQACSADLPAMVELLSECLREPAFDPEDFATEQARLIAELESLAGDPSALAAGALSRLLYSPGHPRHEAEFAEQTALAERITLADVRRHYRDSFRPTDLCVVAVGDLDPLPTATHVDRHLRAWSRLPAQSARDADTSRPSARDVRQPVPGSEHFDVRMGQRLAVRCDHPDYMPLWMANHLLGGTFTSRLVATVRETQGLTYSIRSELAKPDRQFDGHWQVALSLSPDMLDAGLAATRAEITRLVDEGVTAHELAARQVEAIGAFQISLATLYGLSETLLFGAERGSGANYIHEFAGMVGAVTADSLNRCVREYLEPSQWRTAIAGPFADAG